MNSIPNISSDLALDCFSSLRALYSSDSVKLLNAAQAATSGEPGAFIIVPGSNTNNQIDVIKERVRRTADRYGQKLLIKMIEHLYEDLILNGAIGVTDIDFLECTKIILRDGSKIQYKGVKKWHWAWNVEVNNNPGSIDMDIRTGNIASGEIVPEYVLQYIQQSVIAFKEGRHAVSMALMTIGLEGTLRDALHAKGITYQYGSPSQDVYEIGDIQVHKDPIGYKIIFPDPMPQSHTSYLSAPTDPSFKTFKVKRVKKGNGKFILEMRDVVDLIDHWSSDHIVTHATPQVSGLGAALDIGRNQINIITPIDIPEDLDKPIQSVRNNLIHLSGASMTEVVQQDMDGNNITLAAFLNNENRVFDAICTIGNSINTLYNRIADGTI